MFNRYPDRFYTSNVGGIIDDIVGPLVDVATSVADPFVDVATSAFDLIPGSDWVKETYAKSLAPRLKAMASTPEGLFIIKAFSGMYVFLPLSSVIGATAASVAWAIPGMAQGDSFSEAYTKETVARIEAVIEYFVSKELTPAAKDQAGAIGAKEFEEQLSKVAGDPDIRAAMDRALPILKQAGVDPKRVLADLHLTPEEIARKLDVRPDVAALILNALAHQTIYPLGGFDVPTGQNIQLPEQATLVALAVESARNPTPENIKRFQDFAALIDSHKIRLVNISARIAEKKAELAAELAAEPSENLFMRWRNAAKRAALQFEQPFITQTAEAAEALRVAYLKKTSPLERRQHAEGATNALAARGIPASSPERVFLRRFADESSPPARGLLGKIVVAGVLLSPAVLALFLVPRRP